jgi:hypothetical protein
MSDGEFKLAQIQLGRIYPWGSDISNQWGGDTVLEPDEARINPVGRIYPTRVAATALEPDGGQINPAGQICVT